MMSLAKIILHIAVNAVAVYVASILLDDVNVVETASAQETLTAFAIIGTALWVGYAVIRPILKLLTFPLIFLTFGLFNIIINILILWGVDIFVPQFEITGFIALLATTFIVSLAGSALYFIL
ncbi:MAG: phage holin family protein [Candidatus Spechtbacterales bacterium]